jgi:hypothetical protein
MRWTWSQTGADHVCRYIEEFQDTSVGEDTTWLTWSGTRSVTQGRSVMKRIRIGRRRDRSERPWLEALSTDPRDPDIVRAKAIARTASTKEAPGK